MGRRKKRKSVKLPLSLVVILLVVLVAAVLILYFTGALDKYIYPEEKGRNEPTVNVVDGDLQIYSIEMRDKYGDSVFIKYGEYDILIDAGDQGDGEFVRDFVDSHISSDKNLDLLVVTHCHSDHMGGLTKMGSGDNDPKALDNVSTISNILDFGHVRYNSSKSDYYTMYGTYKTLRDSYIAGGAKYYSAYEAVHGLNGLTSTITFGDLSIDILDTNTYVPVGDEAPDTEFNDYSVATLFTYKNVKLFCAGDLEDKGEANLIANAGSTKLNDIKASDNVIYKACHHGTDVGTANSVSNGASSTDGGNRIALLKIIKPDYCFISSAIGESSHPYPRALATMLYFTEYVYFNGTNGTICFDTDGTNLTVTGLGATTNYVLEGIEIDYDVEKNKKFIDTVWYNNFVFDGAKSWYKGDIENPTLKELTEWYLDWLRKNYS